MSATKRCTQCKRKLSLDQFSNNRSCKDGKTFTCKQCDSERMKNQREIGVQIRLLIIKDAGGCQNPKCCSANYGERLLLHDENYANFQLDHIDESLKISKYETDSFWIAGHQDDFFQRVKSNIQVLCYQCHILKTKNSRIRGNSLDIKMFGRKKPAQFVESDYDLFNQVETTDTSSDEDKWTFEDNWSVCRDSEGFLVKYIDLQKGSTQFQIFNKDGEQI